MNNNGKGDHIHIYEAIRGISGNYTQFRCMHPDCFATYERSMIIGKRAQCPFGDCKREFILTKAMLRIRKPHPKGCTKDKCAMEEIGSIIESLI